MLNEEESYLSFSKLRTLELTSLKHHNAFGLPADGLGSDKERLGTENEPKCLHLYRRNAAGRHKQPMHVIWDIETVSEVAVTPDPRDWLVALVEGSHDAVISKDLNGTIRSWNPAAERLFGYTAQEAIGRNITMIIPEERISEESLIISQIRAGRRVDHFETLRRRKDGSLVPLSLSVSPIRNVDGTIVGASKIARDDSLRRQNEETLHLVVDEMQHRVKNLFSLAAAVVSLTGRSSTDAQDIVTNIHSRLSALARAHELTMARWQSEGASNVFGDLLELIGTVLEPYRLGDCIMLSGDQIAIGPKSSTSVALLFYELATNAAKYGALSVPEGALAITAKIENDAVSIEWDESNCPHTGPAVTQGFGARLESTLLAALSADIRRDWLPNGLRVTMSIPLVSLAV
ncbi:PAS domain S-box protein [Devosia sp. MC521]|uniref:PAS domain S-box protein n=1 Tax=Devosia sp. MC521 TaxID=2759954 RepID=UPI0015FB093F|nr:PAS domain S-box protein [Devosia sp. MC521]MBJ6987760.1 PAS domain S-box protein [Devosia sp. MC521]QMW62433.1 PAS domain S-box protein [Devosia sp. MC521]